MTFIALEWFSDRVKTECFQPLMKLGSWITFLNHFQKCGENHCSITFVNHFRKPLLKITFGKIFWKSLSSLLCFVVSMCFIVMMMILTLKWCGFCFCCLDVFVCVLCLHHITTVPPASPHPLETRNHNHLVRDF